MKHNNSATVFIKADSMLVVRRFFGRQMFRVSRRQNTTGGNEH